jgi:hypothetical protein
MDLPSHFAPAKKRFAVPDQGTVGRQSALPWNRHPAFQSNALIREPP